MKKEIVSICPNCNGKQYVYDRALGLLSIGMGYFIGKKEKCEECNGKGYKLNLNQIKIK